MGLELIITEKDIKTVLIGQREPIMRVGELIRPDGEPEYHPNLFTETAVVAAMGWSTLRRNKDAQTLIGEGNYRMLAHLLTSLPVVARELHTATVKGSIAEAEGVGDYLIHAYFTLLSGVAMACNQLLRISTAGLEDKVAKELVSNREHVAKIVVAANALYAQDAAAEFLRLTDSGRTEYVRDLLTKVLKP